jgi:hypothetical protein
MTLPLLEETCLWIQSKRDSRDGERTADNTLGIFGHVKIAERWYLGAQALTCNIW